jgi:uroporphyrin-III C-methyltransferase/precorrin-2 dehydrogenase/sirohydrochlorin ferrochelatase
MARWGTPKLKALPVAFVTTGRSLLLVGAGREIQERLRHARRFDWRRIRLVSKDLPSAIRHLAARDPRVLLRRGAVTARDVAGADLVLANTGDPAATRRLAGWCRVRRVPLNALDDPAHCDVYSLSLLFRDPLVLALGSGGVAPAISRALRLWLDARVGRGWAAAARLLARVRGATRKGPARMALLRRIARHPSLPALIERNDTRGIRALIRREITRA